MYVCIYSIHTGLCDKGKVMYPYGAIKTYLDKHYLDIYVLSSFIKQSAKKYPTSQITHFMYKLYLHIEVGQCLSELV